MSLAFRARAHALNSSRFLRMRLHWRGVIVHVLVNSRQNEKMLIWYAIQISELHISLKLKQKSILNNWKHVDVYLKLNVFVVSVKTKWHWGNLGIQKIDLFLGNGALCLSVIVLLARALTKNHGLSKIRNNFWFGIGNKKWYLFGCRRDSQNCLKNICDNPILFRKLRSQLWSATQC